ncbi:RnfABCDGE type electron transport complex subunit G [Clostridium sp. P21]|uniref:Ion-translocating oxidoreductase complex subunit G n=1 Tax=Clostridium muellerianum TaxID=2716538 RepID=A0A7Y0ED78_9CLOT|nr:RnfABCDGE type electron transport complex subunit G [Clostridium muellerianum]NMM61339.1 RnfABCDGE type electron transport complex subunit G [Clostridium muellerianum]
MAEQHVEKHYSTFQIAMNLTAACFISGIIIAMVYFVTHPIAVKNSKALEVKSMQKLISDADKFEKIQGKEGWYTAKSGGKTVGYIIPVETKGYGGAIKMLVAVTEDDKVIDYNIQSANETPGLGDNAAKEPFRKEFKGKKSEDLEVVKDPSNTKNIQAMTGATISSRAVTKGVKEAVENAKSLKGGK